MTNPTPLELQALAIAAGYQCVEIYEGNRVRYHECGFIKSFRPCDFHAQLHHAWGVLVDEHAERYGVIRFRRTRPPHVEIWQGDKQGWFVDGDIDMPLDAAPTELLARTLALIALPEVQEILKGLEDGNEL